MGKKIDFNQRIYDLDDKVIEDVHRRQFGPDNRVIKNGPELTLGGAVSWVLGYSKTDPTEKPLDIPTTNRYYGLALAVKMSMRNNKPIELESEDLVLIKSLINMQYTAIIAGACNLLLEGKKAYQPAPATPEPDEPSPEGAVDA